MNPDELIEHAEALLAEAEERPESARLSAAYSSLALAKLAQESMAEEPEETPA